MFSGSRNCPSSSASLLNTLDNRGNLRYYEPDFVVLDNDGTRYIVETKGLEDVNVAYKERAARLWCENSTLLTGLKWAYLIVRQTGFQRLQPTAFSDLSFM